MEMKMAALGRLKGVDILMREVRNCRGVEHIGIMRAEMLRMKPNYNGFWDRMNTGKEQSRKVRIASRREISVNEKVRCRRMNAQLGKASRRENNGLLVYALQSFVRV
jgi:hypothetical protein